MGLSERFACRVTGGEPNHPAPATHADDTGRSGLSIAGLAASVGRGSSPPRIPQRLSRGARRGLDGQPQEDPAAVAEEGLRVPQRRRRKRRGTSTTGSLVPSADAPNRVWAVDFQFDATTDGRPLKIVSMVDEHTRECLGGLVERGITGDDLIDELAASPLSVATQLCCAVTTALNWRARRWRTGPANESGCISSHLASPGATGTSSRSTPSPRRTPEHQHLLVPRPGPSRDQRLGAGLQPPPTPQRTRLPGPSGLRCNLHTPLINSHTNLITHRGSHQLDQLPRSHHIACDNLRVFNSLEMRSLPSRSRQRASQSRVLQS